MKRKAIILCLLVSHLAGIALAEGTPAYFVVRKGLRPNLVNVNGELLSVRDFQKLCKEKSPAAAEQLKLCAEKRGGSFFSGLLGFVFTIAGYNRYLSARDITDSQGIATRQAEGLGFFFLGAVSAVVGHMEGISAQDAQNRAIELYNRDSGRLKISFGNRTAPAGLTLSRRF